MSYNAFSVGLVGILVTPFNDQSEEDGLRELLDAQGFLVNYEGTLIYSNQMSGNMDDEFHLHTSSVFDSDHFFKELKNHGYPVKANSIRTYIDLYYNGGDDNQSLITLEEFTKLEKS